MKRVHVELPGVPEGLTVYVTAYLPQADKGSERGELKLAVEAFGGVAVGNPRYNWKHKAIFNLPDASAAIKELVTAYPRLKLYKSGVLTGKCGTNLDHSVLAIDYGTSGYYKVKNSWGASWGEAGFIRMARNAANASGTCGIALQASYPVKAKGAAPPLPPATPNGTRPGPVPQCPGCAPGNVCSMLGMHCCCGPQPNIHNGTTCHHTPACCCGNSTGAC